MNVIPINECCKSDFHITFLGSMEMSQRVTKPAFSSLDHPKKQDMLLFVSDCRTQYFTHDGKIINTKDGDVVYVPKGSRYRVVSLCLGKRSHELHTNTGLSPSTGA